MYQNITSHGLYSDFLFYYVRSMMFVFQIYIKKNTVNSRQR